MALSKEETYQVLALLEEKVQQIKIDRDRFDGYYQKAKKDMSAWGAAITKLETQMLDIRATMRRIKEDSDA